MTFFFFFFSLLWLLQEFAMSLRNRVSSISVMPKLRTLTFVLDACKMLEQARKVRLDKLLNSVDVFYAFLKVRRCQPCSLLQTRGDRIGMWGGIASGQKKRSRLPFPALTLSWVLCSSQSGHRIWSLAQVDTMELVQGSIFRVFIYWVWSISICLCNICLVCAGRLDSERGM